MKTSIQSFVVCFMMILLSRGVSWSATIYMSTQEAKENNLTGQYIADSLDDYWISGFDPIINSTSYLYTQTPFTITGNIGTSTVILEYPQINAPTIKTSISLRNMTGSDLRGQLHTTSFPSISDASTLQDTAPKPFSLKDSFFWNEESAGSTTSKNGILFEFNQPIGGFGVRLGDVETRTDGTGVAAEVKLFDIYGNLIQTRFIQPTLGDQSTCGGSTSTSSPSECGNETTRFVGFTDNTYQVASMLIIVGDDDAGDDGFREHLSFVGPTVALEIKPGMCNTTINNSSLDTGSLPSVDTLCSQGVISGLIQTSSGRSRTCEGINTTSSSSCSLTIALPTPPTTGTGNSSSGSSNNTGSSSNGSGMTTNSGSTGNTGGNINTGSTMNTGSTITSGSITTGSSTGSSSNSSTGSSTSGSVMSGSSTQSGSSSTGNSSGTTGNSSSGSSNNTGGSSNGSGMTTNSGSTGNTGGNINTGGTMNTGSTITSGSTFISIPVTRPPQGTAYQIIPLPTPQHIMSGSGTTIKRYLKKILNQSKSGIFETIVQTIIPQALPETGASIKRMIKKLHYYNTTTLSSLGYRVVK